MTQWIQLCSPLAIFGGTLLEHIPSPLPTLLRQNDSDALQKMNSIRRTTRERTPQDPSDSSYTDQGENYVRLNIGGKSYCIRKELYTEERTLMHDIVESTHEQRLALVDGCDSGTGEYYLERNSRLADHIVDFFATGSLHRPMNMCVEKFKEELAFWRISHDHMASCCSFPRCSSGTKPTFHGSNTFDDFETDFDGACMQSFRLSTWRFLEDPQSSLPAAIFAILSVLFVFGSVFGLILGSMPEFQEDPSNASAYHSMHAKTNEHEKLHKFLPSATRNEEFPNFVYRPTDNPSIVLVVLEYICIGWFTFEYLIRFIIYPKRGEFLRKTLNIIDMMTILPFYLELCLPAFGVESHFKEFTGAMLVVRVLRVLKMARVFKLARYSSSLQTFGQTLKSSITELSMLSMFLLTGIIFFSTIMYYLEKDEPHSDFYSIPAACWWCVVTMATVGYGDAKPVTAFGKLVATATSICGIIVLAFPISMIVEKFATAQQRAMEDEQLHQAQVSAAANNYLLRRFPTRRKLRRERANGMASNALIRTVA
ncbi:hypothetical protein Q1695_002659 [Nippostrongylus brasiliensis]|nr:hypothetical protein Q1695_002659 [Nippostrongylus brasiliensis]